jgi:hypothetical protein
MVSKMAPFRWMTLAEFRRITEVTYLGYVHGTFSALHRMLPRDRGVVLQVGSALAYRSIPLQSAYCGAKHAIMGVHRSVANRVAARQEQRAGAHRPPAGGQHAADRLDPQPHGWQEQAGRDDLPARGGGRRDRLDRVPRAPPKVQLGYPTVEAILGDKIAPRLLDHYLATTVYEGHVTKVPDPPGRPDNLFEAVPGDFAAHGPYDAEAWTSSPQMWLNKHRNLLAVAGVGLAAAVGTALLAGDRQRSGNHSRG